MAVRFPDMPQPAETHINHFFDNLISCLNQRRLVLLAKARYTRHEMATRPAALARTEQELIEAKTDIERRLQMNVLRETQLELIGKLEEKLAEVRLSHPSTRLVFLGECEQLEQLILNVGDVLEEEVPVIPRYQDMRKVKPTPQDDTLLGSYPEPAEGSHPERGVSGGEQEREREREQGGDAGGHESSSYAFVSSIHTPQTAAKIAEPKFQTRTVYPPKKKPVSGGLVARPVRESRPTGPIQTGGYRPKFESANRPRESFQIFVGGLPKECSEVELKECFGKHAAVVDVRTNPSGFGFVGFASEEQVARIIELGDRFFSIRGSFIRVERKGSSAGKPIGVKKRDGQRSGTQPRYL